MRWSLRLFGGLTGSLITSGALAQTPAAKEQFASDRVPAVRQAVALVLPTVSLTAGEQDTSPVSKTPAYALEDLVRLGLDQNPRLAQAALSVDAARGRALQAGLYPNPTVGCNASTNESASGLTTNVFSPSGLTTNVFAGCGSASADEHADASRATSTTTAMIADRCLVTCRPYPLAEGLISLTKCPPPASP